jgi:hypothetical protein
MLLAPSILSFELGGTTQASEFDFINVTGDATFDGDLQLYFINSFQNSVDVSDTFTILSASSIVGAFDNVADGLRLDTSDGLGSFFVDYSGNDLVLSQFAASAAVPEPSSMLLMMIACGALGVRRRWRTKTES